MNLKSEENFQEVARETAVKTKQKKLVCVIVSLVVCLKVSHCFNLPFIRLSVKNWSQ